MAKDISNLTKKIDLGGRELALAIIKNFHNTLLTGNKGLSEADFMSMIKNKQPFNEYQSMIFHTTYRGHLQAIQTLQTVSGLFYQLEFYLEMLSEIITQFNIIEIIDYYNLEKEIPEKMYAEIKKIAGGMVSNKHQTKDFEICYGKLLAYQKLYQKLSGVFEVDLRRSVDLFIERIKYDVANYNNSLESLDIKDKSNLLIDLGKIKPDIEHLEIIKKYFTKLTMIQLN